MRPILLALLLFTPVASAGGFGATLRALRADDRQRRREALEALASGRVRPADRREAAHAERALGRFFQRRSLGAERALAVRALGRLGAPAVYERLLDRLGGERDDRVLLAAAEVFGRAPATLVDGVARRVDGAGDDPLERAVFVRLLGALPGDEARRRIRLRARVADHWCPRAAAAHALARDRSPEAFPPLVELLDASEPALVTAATESLTRLTRREFGRDVVAWKAWWNTRGRLAPLEQAAEPALRPGERRYSFERERFTVAPRFFGIPVQGRKVVFVFDVSGSMRYKLPLAYDQLTRAVEGLSSDCMFEVVFFNEHVWPWRGRLSHADPVTKDLLVRHLETIEIRSYTNLFDSIAKALSLGPDEVFVISDGAPNRGRWRLPRDIAREVKKLNAGHARIHTVSVVRVVDGDEHVALLRTLATQNQGQHVERTLK